MLIFLRYRLLFWFLPVLYVEGWGDRDEIWIYSGRCPWSSIPHIGLPEVGSETDR